MSETSHWERNSSLERMGQGALEGLRVLDLGEGIAGPFGATLLADFGAEVIKVEHPEKGDILRWLPPFAPAAGRTASAAGPRPSPGEASLWWAVDGRNKKSFTADLSRPEGQEQVRRLVALADVVIDAFRPGTLERWKLGYEELRRINPRIILVRASGFGQSGPYRDRPGTDLTGAALGGIASLTGYPDGPPVRTGTSMGAYLTGLFSALATLLALYDRDIQATGLGQEIDLALYEPLLRVSEYNFAHYHLEGAIRERIGNGHPAAAPLGNFRTRDGRWAFILAGMDHIFARLCRAMDREELVQDPRFSDRIQRGENGAAINAVVADWAREQTLPELVEKLDRAEVPVGPLYSIAEIFEDPHYRARGNLVEVEDPVLGKLRMQGVSPRLSRTPGQIRWSGPRLGEHNAEILQLIHATPPSGNSAPRPTQDPSSRPRLPLEGLRILDLGSSGAGPIGPTILGEFGAEVIKVEEPGGTHMLLRNVAPYYKDSTLFWAVEGRNKRSITLDLRRPEGQELVRRLAAHCDVVLGDFRCGALEKWGLGYEELKRINERLILVTVSTFGQSGPYRRRAGYDMIGLAAGGLVYLTGTPDRPPVRPGLILGDYTTAITNAVGTLIALHARHRLGQGQWIDATLYESIFRLSEWTTTAYDRLGWKRERLGNRHPSLAPSGIYPTRDGRWVVIDAPTDRLFARLAQALGKEEWLQEERFRSPAARVQNVEDLDEAIQRWAGERIAEEVVEILVAAGVPVCPVCDTREIAEDPHCAARGNLIEVEDPVIGPVRMQGVVPRLSRTPGSVRRGAPALGQDNQEIYGGLLGLGQEELQRLQQDGII
ncbi:MAG: CoA transferase [Candidatus Tectomicrobia bacterium]|uniref:CoA transferase n=1 Tax=Tectimicrobiota bacterium TaxID=2528274 RepID=A0A932FZE4_UNCTE|nr:CoA transferase [Candidatus Tectomicrobia bacterium]